MDRQAAPTHVEVIDIATISDPFRICDSSAAQIVWIQSVIEAGALVLIQFGADADALVYEYIPVPYSGMRVLVSPSASYCRIASAGGRFLYYVEGSTNV